MTPSTFARPVRVAVAAAGGAWLGSAVFGRLGAVVGAGVAVLLVETPIARAVLEECSCAAQQQLGAAAAAGERGNVIEGEFTPAEEPAHGGSWGGWSNPAAWIERG